MDADLGMLLSSRAAAAREAQGVPDKYVALDLQGPLLNS